MQINAELLNKEVQGLGQQVAQLEKHLEETKSALGQARGALILAQNLLKHLQAPEPQDREPEVKND